MDQIYFWILILFFIILILDYSDKYLKKKENFETFLNKPSSIYFGENNPENKYFEENNLYKFEPPYTSNSINFNKPKQFSNFTTNGITPSYIKCPSCVLQYDCTNFPNDVDDKNVSTATPLYNDVNFT